MSPRSIGLVVAFVAALSACASGSQARRSSSPTAADTEPLRSLDERQALALIDELLEESSLEPHRGFRLALDSQKDFSVDLRVGDADVGIEWVSAQDRARYGKLLPEPDRAGQLRVLTFGEPNGRPALVLVLDHESYRFHARTKAAAGDDEHAAERRIRRDLLEFIAYAKSQYLL